jgi:Uma2 family endonuclease
MSSVVAKPQPVTIRDYLERERKSEVKHEFVDGELISMAGNREAHNLIVVNLIREISSALKGKRCRAYESNQRVKVVDRPRYRYPDVLVICGPTEFDANDDQQMSITNPKLVVEVLSDSTAIADRGEKFRDYRAAPSFEQYVLVSQTSPMVETFLRQSDGSWRMEVKTGLDQGVELRALGITIPMAEIFANVEFPPEPDVSKLTEG